MSGATYLKGPIEMREGKLVLLIRLNDGGDKFIECTRGIGEVEGDCLRITIQDWLASKMGFRAGSIININNEDGKFTMEAEDV